MASSYPSTAKANRRFAQIYISDIGTAGGTAGSGFFTPGFRGRIKKISIPISAVITGADAVITASIGTTAVTGGGVTVALAGTAVGNIYTAEPTAAIVFQSTDYIKLVSDGGPGSVNPVVATVELEIL